jgi:hypothetical protein
MKALTIRQPWATLIILGAKCYEYRSWHPPLDLPARIAIHAASIGPTLADCMMMSEEQIEALLCEGYWRPDDLPRGVVLGTVAVVGVEEGPPEWERFGRFAWTLADPEQWEVTPTARGQLGLWTWNGTKKVA